MAVFYICRHAKMEKLSHAGQEFTLFLSLTLFGVQLQSEKHKNQAIQKIDGLEVHVGSVTQFLPMGRKAVEDDWIWPAG